MGDSSLDTIKSMLEEVKNTQSDMEYMLREMEKTLTQLNQTVVGNPTYGHKGLVNEINDIKQYVDKDKMLKNKLLGGLTVIGIIWSLIYSYITNLLKG
jgi:aminopeptidase-like protein